MVDDAAEPQQRRVTYDRNFQGLLRTRAYAKGLGVQACPRRLQRLLCPDTHDFDIQNAVFVILHQLIKKLQGSIDVPDFVLETIQRCAEHRNIICEEDMETSIKEGKHVLHEVLFGAVVPACYAHVGFLSQLHKTSIYMRWLACSLLQDVFERVQAMADKKNPMASTLFYLYAAIEDHILQSWEEFLETQELSHVSLHFDGVRLGGIAEADVERLCEESATAIKEKTGFEVKIVRKQHLYFREWCRTPSERSEVVVEDLLLTQGNCIPLALARLFPDKKPDILSEIRKASHQNCEAVKVGSRSYRSVCESLKIHAVPSLGLNVTKPGQYLLHCEHDGKPHCVSCTCNENNLIEIGDGKYVTRMMLSELQKFASEAIDAQSIVTFALYGQDGERLKLAKWLQVLQDLHAGANVADPEWVMALSHECEYAGEECSEDECDVQSEDDNKERVVKVGDSLLACLASEVNSFEQSKYSRCPFCPFRSFQYPARVAKHVRRYHTASKQYTCSGTKQLKIICALFDNDQIARHRRGNYLSRSASLLRSMVQPPLAGKLNEIDRSIRLVLTGKGPEFWNAAAVDSSSSLRRVRNLYYTVDFSDLVYMEMLLNNAKCKAAACLLSLNIAIAH